MARRYWHQGAASKAFRSWRDYNRHLRHAEEVGGVVHSLLQQCLSCWCSYQLDANG